MTSSESRARAEALIGKVVADRYVLGAVLGSTGSGATFEAEGPGTERHTVRLLYSDRLHESAKERILREAAYWPRLRHQQVLPVLTGGRDETLGAHFLVSPRGLGRTLEHVLSERGALDPAAAVKIALEVAYGVEAAHRLGLLHRGLKPAVIGLEPNGAPGELVVRVAEFGTACPALPTGLPAATDPQGLLDPPDYAAPEQLRDPERVDERADVWGLGATLYEMLCGSPPFGHLEEVADVVTAILTDEVPHVQDRAPWVDAELCRVVHRALAHDPDGRFATCEELAAALRPFASGDMRLLESAIRTVPAELRARVAVRADLAAPAPAATATASQEADDLALTGRVLDGKYRVLRLLGQGGMGAVYEVAGPNGESLAAKVILRGLSSESPAVLMRFAREAKAASEIVSPNVVRTLDAATDPTLALPYIVMEFLRGTDLSAVLKSRGALDPQVAVRLSLQAARGIAAAHARRVVHRDVKPANLFLQIDERTREVTVKVCDFGVAKRKRSEDGHSKHSHFSLTRTGGMIGSPMYMSPEQARNAKSVDERADVWSLCVVLWEALSGQRLWGQASSLGELIVSICTEPIPRLDDVAPWVPRDLGRVVQRGLTRDLAQRTPDMQSLIAGLELFSGGSDRVSADQLEGLGEERKAELVRRQQSAEARASGSLHPAGRTSSVTRAAPRASGASTTLLVVVLAFGIAGALAFALAR